METSFRLKSEWRSADAALRPRNRFATARIPRLVFKPPRKPCLNQRNNALRIAYSIVKPTLAFAFALCALIALNAWQCASAQPLPKTMKAMVGHQYGGPEVLKYEDVPLPKPKENEILVRVIASGVNPADPLILNGKYAKEFGTHLPLVLGYDMAGVVVKTGAKVTKLKVGDPVYAYLLWGGRLGRILHLERRRIRDQTEIAQLH